MPKLIDLTGQRFGSWTVLYRDPEDYIPNTDNYQKHSQWVCRCDCGRVATVLGSNLRQGHSKGCVYCHNKKRAETWVKYHDAARRYMAEHPEQYA